MTERSQTGLWVAAAQRGDRLALAKLLARCHLPLRKWAETRLHAAMKGRVDADDLLQEVYLDVARQINRFQDRGPGSFYNWLHAILRQKLADALRAARCRARDIAREIPLAGASAGSYWNLLDELYAESGTPSRIVSRQEALEALATSLSDLPEPRRQVIQLRFLEGLTVGEVASRLGKSEDAVVALTRRALTSMRASMDNIGDFTRSS